MTTGPSPTDHPRLRFAVATRREGWIDDAPVRVEHHITVASPPADVWAILADHARWPEWFAGMRKARVDVATPGVGTVRTVWVGATVVQERFTAWEPGRRMSFDIIGCNVPGIAAMAEDWRLAPHVDGTSLDIAIGVAPAGPLRLAAPLVRAVMARATRGAAGVAQHATRRALDDFAP